MRKFFFILSGALSLVAIIVIAINLQNEAPYWLFSFKNGSLFSVMSFTFVTGFLAGIFFVLGFTAKKVDAGDNDF